LDALLDEESVLPAPSRRSDLEAVLMAQVRPLVTRSGSLEAFVADEVVRSFLSRALVRWEAPSAFDVGEGVGE
jgi:hypothetical protein